jgi:hypothetical protein
MPRRDLLRPVVAATALFSLAAMASVASGSGGAAPEPPASILIRGDVQIGRFRVPARRLAGWLRLGFGGN